MAHYPEETPTSDAMVRGSELIGTRVMGVAVHSGTGDVWARRPRYNDEAPFQPVTERGYVPPLTGDETVQLSEDIQYIRDPEFGS